MKDGESGEERGGRREQGGGWVKDGEGGEEIGGRRHFGVLRVAGAPARTAGWSWPPETAREGRSMEEGGGWRTLGKSYLGTERPTTEVHRSRRWRRIAGASSVGRRRRQGRRRRPTLAFAVGLPCCFVRANSREEEIEQV